MASTLDSEMSCEFVDDMDAWLLAPFFERQSLRRTFLLVTALPGCWSLGRTAC